eukprot:CAMPEP_0184668912 /NCGR_PEP_ID=MMETSP0308-20130426/74714_1 /TAXON_ID=38269 /ORGANISM="Gloeochaete witrockiana, Strain SAG 46.84" /LENGTH=555 /DNA_ID=CAMNT_0027114889 /DNA_START=59 /DNA_END=1723 /DNA_ORIENTATION=+
MRTCKHAFPYLPTQRRRDEARVFNVYCVQDLSKQFTQDGLREAFVPLEYDTLAKELSRGDDSRLRLSRSLRMVTLFQALRKAKQLSEAYRLFTPSTKAAEASKLSESERTTLEADILKGTEEFLEDAAYIRMQSSDALVLQEDSLADPLRLPVEADWEALDSSFFARNKDHTVWKGSKDVADMPGPLEERILMCARGFTFEVKPPTTFEKLAILEAQALRSVVFRPLDWILAHIPVAQDSRQSEDNSLLQRKEEAFSVMRGIVQSIRKRYGDLDNETEMKKQSIWSSFMLKTISDGVPVNQSVLDWLLDDTPSEEPAFQQMLVLYRYASQKKEKSLSEMVRLGFNPRSFKKSDFSPADFSIHLKVYRNVPINDWISLVPVSRLVFRGQDLLKLDFTALIGLIATGVNFVTEILNPYLKPLAIGIVGLYAFRTGVQRYNTRERYRRDLLATLLNSIVEVDEAVYLHLAEAASQQAAIECLIAYNILLEWSTACRAEQVKSRAEEWLLEKYSLRISFRAKNALERLVTMKLVQYDYIEDSYASVTVSQAASILQQSW